MTMSNSDAMVLVGQDLAKDFVQGDAKIRVLRAASISVRAGERIAIVGASGSGKTTLLQLLGGLDLPTSGTVEIAGSAMNRLNDAERGYLRNRAVGFVYQFHHLLPEFTALENVAMPLLSRGQSLSESEHEASRWLREVGLEARGHHRSGELSGGEQQRVSLARALITQPRVLLADEPTGDLDGRTGELVFELVARLHREHQLTSLIATHNLAFARRCHRVLRLDQGKIEEVAPASLLA